MLVLARPRSHYAVFLLRPQRNATLFTFRRRFALQKKLTAVGDGKLPHGLTPHSLRRTFASILFALGESPPYPIGQMGHTTPNLALSIYARQMDRRDGEPERLKAPVQGEELVPTGTEAAEAPSNGTRAVPSEPVNSGIPPE
jgi:integrase